MREKELIEKLLALKEIKPNREWVVLTKNQILEKEFIIEEKLEQKKLPVPFFLSILKLKFKPVFASLVVLFFVFGAFIFAQNSLPGDFLYPLKRITEKGQEIFVSEKELPNVQLDLAKKRLEELNKVAKEKEVQKISPGISEFKSTINQASRNLAKLKVVNKKIVEKTVELEKSKEKLEKVLGTKIETPEYENALKELIANEIEFLEKSTLNEQQKKILSEIKAEFEKGNYNQALEKILLLKNGEK